MRKRLFTCKWHPFTRITNYRPTPQRYAAYSSFSLNSCAAIFECRIGQFERPIILSSGCRDFIMVIITFRLDIFLLHRRLFGYDGLCRRIEHHGRRASCSPPISKRRLFFLFPLGSCKPPFEHPDLSGVLVQNSIMRVFLLIIVLFRGIRRASSLYL